jgi:regulator of sigma E protease
VPFTAPVIGQPGAGTPAWHARLEAGTEILAVNGTEVFAFDHIPTAVALAEPGGLDLTVRRPGAEASEVVRIVPEEDIDLGVSVVGIGPNFEPGLPMVVTPDGPAAQAGILDGDHLLDVRGGLPGLSAPASLGFLVQRGSALELQVETPGGAPRWVTVPATTALTEQPAFGFNVLLRVVSDLRQDSEVVSLGLRIDDRLLAVNGRPVARAYDLREALAESLGEPVTLEVERLGERLALELGVFDAERVGALCNDVAIRADLDAPELYVYEEGPAYGAGLRTGDRIVRIDGASVETYEDIAAAGRASSSAARPRALEFSVLRQEVPGGPLVSRDILVEPAAIQQPLPPGINFRPHGIVYRADGPVHALKVGAQSTWRFLEDSWIFLKRIVSQDVSAKNAGGIITIGMVSSHWAAEGLAKLFFFLCILSMNLAFLNVLPVPLLDGGHLFFLLIEKLKGSPVSPRIQMMSQAVGMLMLLSLMVYVTYNDVVRWFFP